MAICMHGIRLDVAGVLVERVEDVGALIGAARDEVVEQGDVQVGEVIVANPTEAPIADVVLGQQVALVEIPLGPVGRDALAGPQDLGSTRRL